MKLFVGKHPASVILIGKFAYDHPFRDVKFPLRVVYTLRLIVNVVRASLLSDDYPSWDLRNAHGLRKVHKYRLLIGWHITAQLYTPKKKPQVNTCSIKISMYNKDFC